MYVPFHYVKSDAPRKAGGLMSGAASKAATRWFRRRACQRFEAALTSGSA